MLRTVNCMRGRKTRGPVRYARASCEIAFELGGGRSLFTVSKRMCRATGTRAVCVKASMQCLLYIL